MPDRNVTVVAVWTEHKYELEIELDGGNTDASIDLTDFAKQYNFTDIIDLSALTDATVTKDGYSFNGWMLVPVKVNGVETNVTEAKYFNGSAYVTLEANTPVSASLFTNLTAEDGKQVKLVAVWGAKQIAYSIEVYLGEIGGIGYAEPIVLSDPSYKAEMATKVTLSDFASILNKAILGTAIDANGFEYVQNGNSHEIVIGANADENVLRVYYARKQFEVTISEGTGIASADISENHTISGGVDQFYYGETVKNGVTYTRKRTPNKTYFIPHFKLI